jgi:hypothetical protein
VDDLRDGTANISDVPTGTVVLCSYDDEPQVYQIQPEGFSVRHPRYCSIGSSTMYAELILKDYYRTDMTCEEATFLAYYTLRQASEVDTYVGGPNHIHVVSKEGIKRIPDEEMEALGDAFEIRQAVLKELFARWPELANKVYGLLGGDLLPEEVLEPAPDARTKE